MFEILSFFIEEVVNTNDVSVFDKENYLHWLKEQVVNYPEGFVLAKEDNKYAGQLELSIREYEGKDIICIT